MCYTLSMKKKIYYLVYCTLCETLEVIPKDHIYFKHKCGGLLVIVDVLYINRPHKNSLYY